MRIFAALLMAAMLWGCVEKGAAPVDVAADVMSPKLRAAYTGDVTTQTSGPQTGSSVGAHSPVVVVGPINVPESTWVILAIVITGGLLLAYLIRGAARKTQQAIAKRRQ